MTETTCYPSKANRPSHREGQLRATAVLLVLIVLATACTLGEGTVELVAAVDPQPDPAPTAVVAQPTPQPEQPTPVPPTAPEQPTPVPSTAPEEPTPVPPETPTPPPETPTPPPETPTPPPVTPTPEPEVQRMQLRPIDSGIDGWSWSSNDTPGVAWSNAHWRWQPTHYRVSTEIASVFGVALNENSQASAGGRRRFTPPQPTDLWLNIDAHLSGVLAVLPGIGSSSQVTVVARIQTTRAGGNEPEVKKEIKLYEVELRSSLDGVGDIAQTTVVEEQLRINELLPPLEMGAQYHMELEVRCETKTLAAARVGGFCSFGLNELNDSLGVPVPVGKGLILNDAWLDYTTNA